MTVFIVVLIMRADLFGKDITVGLADRTKTYSFQMREGPSKFIF